MPQKTYSTSLLELQSLHKVTQFVKNCGKDHFYVNPVQTSRQCQEDVFSLTIGFNEGPLACKCNPTGSKSTFCEQFGGQCPCVPNVVGRICNRCRLGYSGFPRCKREYFKFLLFFFIVDAAIKVPKLWTCFTRLPCWVTCKGQTFYFVQLIVVFEYINYRVEEKNLMSLTKMVATWVRSMAQWSIIVIAENEMNQSQPVLIQHSESN